MLKVQDNCTLKLLEGKMLITKEKLLADLYALRGGLSIISKYTDQIRGHVQIIKENTDKKEKRYSLIFSNKESLKQLETEKQNILDQIQKVEESIKEIKSETQAQLLEKEKALKTEPKKNAFEVSLLFLLVGWGALVCAFLLGLPWLVARETPAVGMIIFLLIVYALSRMIAILACSCSFYDSKKEIKKKIVEINACSDEEIKEEYKKIEKKKATAPRS